jgi:hypothetical protein
MSAVIRYEPNEIHNQVTVHLTLQTGESTSCTFTITKGEDKVTTYNLSANKSEIVSVDFSEDITVRMDLTQDGGYDASVSISSSNELIGSPDSINFGSEP